MFFKYKNRFNQQIKQNKKKNKLINNKITNKSNYNKQIKGKKLFCKNCCKIALRNKDFWS